MSSIACVYYHYKLVLLANISLDLTCELSIKDLIVDKIVTNMANDYIYMKLLLKIIQCSLIPCLIFPQNNLMLIW